MEFLKYGMKFAWMRVGEVDMDLIETMEWRQRAAHIQGAIMIRNTD